ncbi:MAG: Xaa-Pro peptidase family protein [Trueperaceae bacterium]
MASIPQITPEEFRDRQSKAVQAADDMGAAALLVVGGPFYDRPGDLAYLTGHYPPFPSSNYEGDYRGLGYGAVVLPVDGGAYLVSDTAAYREERVVADDIRPARNVPRTLAELLRELKLASQTVAFVGSEVAPYAFVHEFAEGLSLDLKPADSILRSARRKKSADELAMLRRAAQVAEVGMAAALAAIESGQTESEVCAQGIMASMAAGADFVRYLRVLSGPYAGWPHRWPPATDRVLQDGETVCMDLIGAVNGYQFDILRAGVVGEGSDETRGLMQLARDATEAAISACGPRVPVRDVVAAADDVLAGGGQLGNRAGFTGHGIGLETVEAPLIMKESNEVLREGDVICLEPGILVRGSHGARFEYEVAITDRGHEVLARGEA